MPKAPAAVMLRRSPRVRPATPAEDAESATSPRFCFWKWWNCQAKNGKRSQAMTSGVRTTAAAHPHASRTAGAPR